MNYKHWGGTEAQMILIRMGRHGLCALLALSAVQANADVLEISDDGARWVTGALASVPADVAAEMVDVSVPDVAVADAQLQARIVPRYYAAKVAELSARYDLSPALIEALVWQESRWNAAAVSPKGAQGLAQLMPETARELGVDPRDPYANLEGGARYLREQLNRFEGDLEKALAAYNAGPGRVERANGIPRIRETQHYVAAIMTRLAGHSRPQENEGQ